MMLKRSVLLMWLGMAAIMFLYVRTSDSRAHATHVHGAELESRRPMAPIAPALSPPSAQAEAPARAPMTWPALLRPPTAQRLRAEARANPHAPPPSYVRYAYQWARCMDAIGNDSTRAYDAFTHAEACVEHAPEPSDNVQALCLRHAHHLAGQFSELIPRYYRLRAHVEPRVLDLMDDTPRSLR